MFRRQQMRDGPSGLPNNRFPSISAGGGFSNGGQTLRVIESANADEFAEVGIDLGVCSKQGRRPYQEDEFCAKASMSISGNPMCGDTHFFGLFDGHAGGRCSKFLSTGMVQTLLEDPQFETNLPQCLKHSFHTINENFLKLADRMRFQDGSTGICVVLRENKYLIANVGDCRAILICNGKPIQLSKDQKPTNAEEQKRIYALGGHVVNCMGVTRVNGILAVSRAFGNRQLRDVIRPDAEITQRSLSAGDEFLVIASDGMWDVLSNAQVCELCTRMAAQSGNAIAEELVNQALMKGSMDNITCHVAKMAKFSKERFDQRNAGKYSASKTGRAESKFPDRETSPSLLRAPIDRARKFSGDELDTYGRGEQFTDDSAAYLLPKRFDNPDEGARPSTTAGVGDRYRSQLGRYQGAHSNSQANSQGAGRVLHGLARDSLGGVYQAQGGQRAYGQPYGQNPPSTSLAPDPIPSENKFMAAYNSFHRDRGEASRKSVAAGIHTTNRPMTGSSPVIGTRGGTLSMGGSMGFASISGDAFAGGGGTGAGESFGTPFLEPAPPARLMHSPITTRAQSNRYTQRVSTANSISGRPSIRNSHRR